MNYHNIHEFNDQFDVILKIYFSFFNINSYYLNYSYKYKKYNIIQVIKLIIIIFIFYNLIINDRIAIDLEK